MKNCLLEPGYLSQATPLRLGARSGLITGLSAADQVFGFRNAGTRPFVVAGIDLAFVTTAVSSAAILGVAFAVYKVANFTAIQSGGTPTTIDNILLKRTLGHTEPVSGTDYQCVISGTAAITGGTGASVADADEPFHIAVAGLSQTSDAVGNAWLNERWSPGDGLPLVLDQNEGLIITTVSAFATALAGRLFVGMDLSRN